MNHKEKKKLWYKRNKEKLRKREQNPSFRKYRNARIVFNKQFEDLQKAENLSFESKKDLLKRLWRDYCYMQRCLKSFKGLNKSRRDNFRK